MKQPSGSRAASRAVASQPATSVIAKRKGARAEGAPMQDAAHEDAVRRQAYGYYEARGRVDGHELEDWLRAEAELAQSTGIALAGPALH